MSSSLPVSADVVLLKATQGEPLEVCALCAAAAVLVRLDDASYVHLKDEYNDRRITLLQLVRELQFDHFIGDAASPMICEGCIQNLCTYILFKTKCKKIKSGLNKLTSLIKEDSLEKVINVNTGQPAVVLPHKNLHEYENEPLVEKYLNEDVTRIIRKNYSNFSCTMCGEKLRKSELEKHMILHYYKAVSKNIIAGNSYCICCLAESGLVTKDINGVEMHGDMRLTDVFCEAFGHNNVKDLGEIEVCGSCYKNIVLLYNFKKMFTASATIVRDCLIALEACSTNPKTAVTILDDGTDHGICLLDVYNVFVKFLSPKRIHSIRPFLRPLKMNDEKEIIKPKPFIKNQRLRYEKGGESVENRIEPIKADSITGETETNVACIICSKKFDKSTELYSHRSVAHPDATFCPYCDKVYKDSSKALLKSHMQLCFKLPKPFGCDLCRAKFNTKQKFQTHRLRHYPPGVECDICNKQYFTQMDMRNHKIKIHNALVKYECSVCSVDFDAKADMLGHVAEKHQESSKDAKKEIVEASKVQDEDVDRCDECGKVFKTVHLLNAHKSTHSAKGEKKLSCEQCDYKTNFGSCLEAHINKKHNKTKPYWCVQCKKAFFSKAYLTDHLKNHTNANKFICSVCGNHFLSKKALMLHYRLHTGEKPYGCDICSEKFISASRRQDHKIRKHFDRTAKCDLCSKKFYTIRDVKVHRKTFHSEDKTRQRKCKMETDSEMSEQMQS